MHSAQPGLFGNCVEWPAMYAEAHTVATATSPAQHTIDTPHPTSRPDLHSSCVTG